MEHCHLLVLPDVLLSDTKILKSFKKLKIFDQNDLKISYSSISSVTTEMNNDLFFKKRHKSQKIDFI